MPINRFESIYNQLKETLISIRAEKSYPNLSKAFGAWYLKNQYGLSDSEIEELLIDEKGDHGIDAYILNEDKQSLRLFQFKFPDKSTNIKKKVTQDEIQKFIQGCRIVVKGSTRKKCSQSFKDMLDVVREARIISIELEIVAFNAGLTDIAREDLSEYREEFTLTTGSRMFIAEIFCNELSSLFEKTQHVLNLSIDLPYQTGTAAYNYGKEVSSYLCVVKASDLVTAIGNEIVAINDENIRLFEGDTRINNGIKNTASTDEGKYFYFFNNGITLICDTYDVDATKRILYAKGVSVVNGCQTVTCLYDLSLDGQLNDDVMLLVRVISTTDYGLRADITEYLNSQNSIKDSYLLANHGVVRKLQNELLVEGFYLDRQFNEYKNKLARGIDLPSDVVPIELGAALQYYVGYYYEDDAALAKRNKGALFSGEKAEEILSEATAARVANAWRIHEKVRCILTKYRKLRRNDSNTEFSEFMDLDQNDLVSNIELYRFLNTADILLMSTVHSLSTRKEYQDKSIEELIRVAIYIARDVINEKYDELPPASATKHSAVFADIRAVIESESFGRIKESDC